MQQQQPLGRVQLLVYDLSRGMALTMSQQILGQQIEGIWHTGILVFDVEYYFGGGIQAQQAGMFARQHQMAPARVLDIGVTSKTKNDLQAFLLSLHGRFNASTYDLTRNNCNNFSDTVSQFLTGIGTFNFYLSSYQNVTLLIHLPRSVGT
jgi:desumoylating isopeptidase 1